MGHFPKLQAYSIGLIAAAVFCSSAAFAKVTLLGTPKGASAVIKSTTTGTNPTTTTTIYAGFAGTCATTNGLTTCDSCLGTAVLDTTTNITFTTAPCNFKNAYPSLKLHIELTVSGVTATPTLYLTAFGENIASAATMSFVGTTMTVEIAWGDICSARGSGADCSTLNEGGELEIGVKGASGSTGTNDTITIPFKIRSLLVDPGQPNTITKWFYQDCPLDGTTIGKANEGFCHFKAYKGDSKIYADELGVPGGYPATGQTGVEYNTLLFFYEEQTVGESDADTVARINTASPRAVIPVNTVRSPPASDNRITGLKNNSRYCFVMANADPSGVVYYFTPTQTTVPAPVDPATLCGTPEQVVGLLDDKSCFIATAAFGSDMAPEVQSFRDFRNKYLFSNSIGKEFVRLYYKYSPFYANLIAQNDVARATIRVLLWPLLLFAKVSVQFGLWAGILLLLSSAGLVVLAYRRFNVRRTRGHA